MRDQNSKGPATHEKETSDFSNRFQKKDTEIYIFLVSFLKRYASPIDRIIWHESTMAHQSVRQPYAIKMSETTERRGDVSFASSSLQL